MATVTASLLFSPNVRKTHTGINVTGGAISISGTAAASSVFKLCKVPNHATLVDFWAEYAFQGSDQTMKLGTSATPSGIMAALSLTGGTQFRAPSGTRMPVRISLSSTQTGGNSPRDVWIQGEIGTPISTSAAFTFVLFYTNDGMLGFTTIR